MLIDHIERAEFNAEEMRRGTLVFAKHKTWKEGISGIVYRASAEQITVMYPNSLTNTKIIFFIPVSEVYKNRVGNKIFGRWSSYCSGIQGGCG